MPSHLDPGSSNRFYFQMEVKWALFYLGFPCGSDDKESACNAGDLDLIPELGRSSGGGNGNPLQYSCLEKPMDRGAWWATVYRVARLRD